MPTRLAKTPVAQRHPIRLLLIACMCTIGILVATIDAWVKWPLQWLASAQLGRPMQIEGDVHLSLFRRTPELTLTHFSIANVSGGLAPRFATVERLQVAVDLPALMTGRFVLPRVDIDTPEVVLEDGPDGQGNWHLGKPRSEPVEDQSPVVVQSLQIRGGKLSLELPSRQLLAQVQFDTAEADGQLRFSADGRYQGQAVKVSGRAGSLLTISAAGLAYPVVASGAIGATRFEIDGAVRNLLAMEGLDGHFALAGRSLGDLYPLTGVPLPGTPAYRIAAQLSHTNSTWALSAIDARIGNSDTAGNLTIRRLGKAQHISGALHARHLDLADLSGFIGARSESGKKVAPPAGKVLPASALGFEKIAAADVDLTVAIDDIRNSGLPLSSAVGHVRIADRQVQLSDWVIGMAEGEVRGRVSLDTRAAPAKATLALTASQLRLRALLPYEDAKTLTTGRLGGQATLAMQGNSIASLLGSANGEVALAMTGGSTSRLLVRLVNLDLANGLLAWIQGGQKEDIRCLIGDMAVVGGVLKPRVLALETDRMQIDGQGQISLRDETLDLTLNAHARDSSLVALRGPIQLGGSFAEPSVRVSPLPVTGRLAGAVALGLVSPPLALLPLIELGSNAKDDACKAMVGRFQRMARQK